MKYGMMATVQRDLTTFIPSNNNILDLPSQIVNKLNMFCFQAVVTQASVVAQFILYFSPRHNVEGIPFSWP
jgi:hypothetical protein